MGDNEVIRESDLIQLDGTIDKLINELNALNGAYAAAVEAIKSGAEKMSSSLRTASGATREGKKAIDEAVATADRYKRAQDELAFAMSEVGKATALLKAQTREVNKATVEQHRQVTAAVGSYDRLKSDIEELTRLYKSLSDAEQKDAEFGEQIIKEIQQKNTRLKELNQQMAATVDGMTRLQKAEQELAYWQSEEGQKLLQVKRQIREVTTERKKEKDVISPLAAAKEKLRQIQSGEMNSLYALNNEIAKERKLKELMVREAAAQEGSYERMSLQYARAKEELKTLNLTLPENAQRVADLTKELNTAYAAMRQFQESTGVYSLSVGNYREAFTGLNMAVQQVVRELPAVTVSLNTFFLAISNNIPILADELKRSKAAFEAQKEAIIKSAKSSEEAAEAIGKLEKPIKKVIKSVFSWQTALVLVLTILPKYGEAIFDWIGKMLQGENAAKRMTRALRDIRKEMKDTNDDYGKNMVTIRRLTNEYSNLATEADKTQWIENNKDAWRELNIAVYDVADAEDIFVKNTDKVKQALLERARSAAAYKLAEELFEKQMGIEQKLIDAELEGPNAKDKLRAGQIVRERSGGYAGVYTQADIQQAYEERLQSYRDESAELGKQIDLYYKLGEAAEIAAAAKVGEYDDGTGKTRGGRDVTRYLEEMRVKVIKESESTITRTLTSEFAKRRQEAKATYSEEVGQLQNTYNENKRILDGYYKLRKPLDKKQKAALEASQAQILETLELYEQAYNKTLSDISKDEKIAIAERQNELIQIRLAAAKKGSNEEYELRKQAIEKQRELYKLKNSKLVKSEQQDEIVIDAKYNKQLEDLEADRNIRKLEIKREGIALQLKAIKEGSEAEYELKKSDIEAQMEMEIATNKQLAKEEQMTEEAIRAKYNKQLEDLEYEHQMTLYNTTLEGIRLRLDAVRAGSKEELDLMLEQIEQERQEALAANRQLAKELQQSEADINAVYARRAAFAQGNYDLSSFRAGQTTTKIGVISSPSIATGDEGSRKRELYNIDLELLDIAKQLELFEAGKLELTDEQIANLKLQAAELKKQKKELTGINGVISDIASGGITGGILGALGFDDEAIGAFSSAVTTVIDNINAIMEAEIEAAEVAVEAAEKRVEAAEEAYDAEIEARNNGYANNVESARKELEQERKNQQEKQKLLEEAQRRQEALNTVIQASSLITAAAQLWSTMSAIPVVGPALAAAAIAAMFGSFAVAKIKANQVTASAQYGEGGLEFLEGGSHASGNDISLGTRNSKGKNMRAEGGEALAIINRRNTRRYRKQLPGIIESLNSGTFEDKYLNAFANSGERSISINQSNSIDLSNLENDVKSIRRSNETRYYTAPDGTVIMQYKNLKRTIKN